MVAQVYSIHKDDKRNRHLNDGKFRGNSTTIPRPVGDRNQGHDPMDNRSKFTHGDDKTMREREPSSLPLYKLYTLFTLQYTPERNVDTGKNTAGPTFLN